MTLNVSVCIPAYNEERNMANLLNHLLAQKLPQDIRLEEIIIVSSGSTDRTEDIVREYEQGSHIIKLITEKERSGQASATNLILDNARGDVLVIGCADTEPTSEAILHLIKALIDDPTVGAVVGRAVPINDPETLWGYMAHVAYRWLYEPEILMVDQEGLSAIRKNLIDRLPPHAIAVEHYIDAMVRRKGFRVIHAPDAITYTKQPDNLRDFISQRRRNSVLHLQQEKNGIPAPHISPSVVLPLILRSPKRNPRKLLWLGLMVILFGFTYAWGWIDFKMGYLHNNWKMITSTKSLTSPSGR
ncbi:MAG: glycosyltransferase [Chloroflexota bacterium]